MIKPIKKNFYITIIIIIALFSIFLYIIHNNKVKLEVSVITHVFQNNNLTNNKDANWSLNIPEIGLNAQIYEGTTKETMDKYIGHFEETQKEYGNIGLAAHNRGYAVNYFQNIKELKKGSRIIYTHGNFEMTYIVETIEVIENTNWSYLENTKDNRITLITCVENEPKYRRCIQGVEKVEKVEREEI